MSSPYRLNDLPTEERKRSIMSVRSMAWSRVAGAVGTAVGINWLWSLGLQGPGMIIGGIVLGLAFVVDAIVIIEMGSK